MKKKTFTDPVFDTTLTIRYGDLKEFGLELEFDGYYDKEGNMYIKKGCNIEKTLPHELLHFIYDELLERDISLTLQTEETFAYLMGYYFNITYKRIKGL